jgi:hypothetical protein
MLSYKIPTPQTRVSNCPSGISSLVERGLWELNVRGSIPRSPIVYCAIAQLAERPPVKRLVPGSSPGSTEICRTKRLGAIEPCVEAILTALFCAVNSWAEILRGRLTGRTAPFEGANLGSNPSCGKLWLWSSSLRLWVVNSETWARIPLATPSGIRKIGKSARLRSGFFSVRV